MSNDVLRIIPQDPDFLPQETARDAALSAFDALVPDAAETRSVVLEEIAFFDQGGNFESVSCPRCECQLDTVWWTQAMDAAFESRFSNRKVDTPCCKCAVDLNDLVYVWPAGFGVYALEAQSPGISQDLSSHTIAALENILGCKVKQIWARY